jgi:serine protease Do
MRGDTRLWPSLIALTFVAVSGLSVSDGRSHASSPMSMDTDLFRAIARRQNPIVVAILTTARRETPSAKDIEWFERIFGLPLPENLGVRRDTGSGFLISGDGDILTSNHVVADADVIRVRLLGMETATYRATVVGRDPLTDSALIRLREPPADLPFAILGDSDALQTGDWVMAIGNPYELGHTVTVGVVGHQARAFEGAEGQRQMLIQTDASMNPGSSGGPLLNVRGEVVGINAAMVADELGAGSGIGFAIPINDVKALLPQLRAGKVVRGHLGVTLRRERTTDDDATALGLPRAGGALITSVDMGSTADTAGLQCGDVIMDFAGAAVMSADDLMARVSATLPGSRARAVVHRDGRTRTVEVEVEELPSGITTRAELGLEESANFGLSLGDSRDGSFVRSVEDDSPAAEAGIEEGDIVRKVNRRIVHTAAEATQELQRVQVGHPTFVIVWRGGRETLVEMQRD